MRQADFCGFSGTRDTQVTDQLIEGYLSTKLRLKLLEKGNDLTLDVALKMSSCHESVTQQANEMQLDNIKRSSRVKTGNKPRGPAHRRQPNKTGNEKKCWKCGREGHLSKDDCCPVRKEKCRKCGITGHFAKVCRSKDTHQNRVFSVDQKDANMASPAMRDGSSGDEIFAINLTPEEEPQVEITVGGQEGNVLIDSGALCNVIDQQLWEQLKRKEAVCKSHTVNKTLKSYGTVNKVDVTAKFWSKVELGVKCLTEVEFLVIKGKGMPVLGRKTARKLGVLKITIPEVNLVEDEFQDLFIEKIGKLTNDEVELHLKPNA